jgi:hypothetical protein
VTERVPACAELDRPSGGHGKPHAVRGAAAAAGAAAIVLALRTSGLLQGWPAALGCGLLLLALPTARLLSRRILIGAGLIGWIPLLWWFQLPTGGLGRVTILLALAGAVLAGWLATRDSRRRLRRLVPEVRAADTLILLSAAATAHVTWPWLTSSDPTQALGSLMRGWDNAAHFAIFHLVSGGSSIVDALPTADDGSRWSYQTYPQHFHVILSAIGELLRGPKTGPVSAEVVTFVQALALLVTLSVVAVTAGLVSLPGASRRPLLLGGAGGLLVSTLTLGPGARSMALGHASFLIACAGTIVVLQLALLSANKSGCLLLVATAGGCVAVIHGWTPLAGILAGPILLTLTSWWPELRRFGARGAVAWSVLTVAGLAAIKAFDALIHVDVSTAIVAQGAVQRESAGLQFAIISAAIGAPIAAARQGRKSGHDEDLSRWIILASVPLCGMVMFLGMFTYQVLTTGSIGYYAIKLLVGVAIVSLASLCITVTTGRGPAPLSSSSRHRHATYLLVPLISLQAYGLLWAVAGRPVFLPEASGASLATGKADSRQRRDC